MALRNIKVIELAGLAPAPFCGMILGDFGAQVLRVDKIGSNVDLDCLGNGKQSVALNLKHPEGAAVLRRMCKEADVLIEPFRKGVMERLGLGPEILTKDNGKLVYARLTGYGQSGSYSQKAGHDINYLAVSGLLSLFGRYGSKPTFPANAVADFAGGGLTCAFGILAALLERSSTGKGQIVDSSMVEGSAYIGSWLYRSHSLPLMWGQERGKNLLDTGAHFYDVYLTKDSKYLAVGALEPQFYADLLKGLELTEEEAPQFGDYEKNKILFEAKFSEKPLSQWLLIFEDLDACVSPVLSLTEAPNFEHNVGRNAFQKDVGGKDVPAPAPKLSGSPAAGRSPERAPRRGEHTERVMLALGYEKSEIDRLEGDGIVERYRPSSL